MEMVFRQKDTHISKCLSYSVLNYVIHMMPIVQCILCYIKSCAVFLSKFPSKVRSKRSSNLQDFWYYTFISILPHCFSVQRIFKYIFFKLPLLSLSYSWQAGSFPDPFVINLKVLLGVSPILARSLCPDTCDCPHLSLSKDSQPWLWK